MKRYASSIDLTNPNSSWTILINWVGRNRRVLDVGCGRGQIGEILTRQFGCVVTGIELNPEFARACADYQRVIIGNVEDSTALGQLDEPFDVILCGDVLEHLRDPHVPLRAFHRLLTPEGRLLVSVPNVAQVRIRWMHLRGRWDYTPEGIMDETHLRWFTFASLRSLLKRCGWNQRDFDFTVGPNFGEKIKRLPSVKKFLPPNLVAIQFLINSSH
jgi:2-polyprenyl-3-methyl-5-hydroxy-6-metoxy-1,4-benzoquinol methylase